VGNNAFAINGFTGMKPNEIISAWMMVGVFNVYVVLEALSLYAFYIASKPIQGQVRTAALWHAAASLTLLWSFVTFIWASPAEKSFVGADGKLFTGLFDAYGSINLNSRLLKVIIGAALALIAIGFMLYGLRKSGKQRKALTQAVIA
jgi:hypothetical protein